MVPEIMIGRVTAASSKNFFTANTAALAFRVSNTVSIRIRSAPPFTRPSVAS